MILPDKFFDRLPADFDIKAFIAALDEPSPVSVRFNPYKLSAKPEGEQVPWSRYGFYLDRRPQFTLDPAFHAGAYYPQEASSMFVEHIYRSVIGERTGLRILDLCAAPGGKTTLLSTVAGLENTVIANEVIRQRANILADNVQRWGLGNVMVTNNDPSHFSAFRDYFDLILVDAPCSGEGMFRKDPKALGEWSEANVELCAARQRRIVGDVWPALKPGGIMVYSTCTFNTKENEDNARWICDRYDCGEIKIETPPDWNIVRTAVDSDGVRTGECFRFYPHKVKGEGFFAAVVRKQERKSRTKTPKPRRELLSNPPKNIRAELSRWIGQPDYMHFAQIGDNNFGYYKQGYETVKLFSETMSVLTSGIEMGQVFSGKLRPAHPLAMFHDMDSPTAGCTSLDYEQALDYLRKKELDPALFQEGINAVNFDGLTLGWVKRIGQRVNNMYPKELRIMNL